MSKDEIHLNDIGTVFKTTIKEGSSAVDISSATTKRIHFRKPNGTVVQQTASFFTDGTDGILTYTSVSSDLDVLGKWKLQGYVVLAAGTWSTSIESFVVHKNL